MADFYANTYNPDVLSCLANLSNDEVFTPPEIVNKMLDMMPKELFSDPRVTFLDPPRKVGCFSVRLPSACSPGWNRLFQICRNVLTTYFISSFTASLLLR